MIDIVVSIKVITILCNRRDTRFFLLHQCTTKSAQFDPFSLENTVYWYHRLKSADFQDKFLSQVLQFSELLRFRGRLQNASCCLELFGRSKWLATGSVWFGLIMVEGYRDCTWFSSLKKNFIGWFSVLFRAKSSTYSFQTVASCMDSCAAFGWLWTAGCTWVFHCCSRRPSSVL